MNVNNTVAQADGEVREYGVIEVVLVVAFGTRGWRHGRKQQCEMPLCGLWRRSVVVSESEMKFL